MELLIETRTPLAACVYVWVRYVTAVIQMHVGILDMFYCSGGCY